jgi:hypothetical protein
MALDALLSFQLLSFFWSDILWLAWFSALYSGQLCSLHYTLAGLVEVGSVLASSLMQFE